MTELTKTISDNFNFESPANVVDLLEPMVIDNNPDFIMHGYRFIKANAIFEILAAELADDEYILGCFDASFLSDVTGIDARVFLMMQKTEAFEAFEAIGLLIITGGFLEALAEQYVKLDGYGHHFNHWDGEEIYLDDFGYYAFAGYVDKLPDRPKTVVNDPVACFGPRS